MGNLRVVTWNISIMGPIESKWAFLRSVLDETEFPTLVALQEVKQSDRVYLADNERFSELAFPLDYRPPGPFDGFNRKMGCLIGIKGGGVASNSGVLTRAPFPDRTIFSDLHLNDLLLKCLCFHSLTGVGYKKAKTAQFIGIAEYLHQYR